MSVRPRIIPNNIPLSLDCIELPNVVLFGDNESWLEWARKVSDEVTTPTLNYQHRILQYNIDAAKVASDVNGEASFDWTMHQEIGILFTGLITTYDMPDNIPVALADRLHNRLRFPTNFNADDTYITFETGFQEGDNFLIGEQSTLREDNIEYYILTKGAINHIREHLPTVSYTYSLVPEGFISTGNEDDITCWLVNRGGPGFILREKVTGVPFYNFIASTECTVDILRVLVAQLAYTISKADQLDIGGVTLGLKSALVRPIDIALPTPDGYLNCSHLVCLTNFRRASAKVHETEVGKLVRDELSPLEEIRKVLSLIDFEVAAIYGTDLTALTDLKQLDSLSDIISALAQQLAPLYHAPGDGTVIPKAVLGNTCNFYLRYSKLQYLNGVSYSDLHQLLSGGTDDYLIDWLNRYLDIESIIDDATAEIERSCGLAESFINDEAIMTEKVITGDVKAFTGDLGQLTTFMFDIITLVNSTVSAAYLSGYENEVFSKDLENRITALRTLHDEEIFNIEDILAKYEK